jgi:hypothetical protein
MCELEIQINNKEFRELNFKMSDLNSKNFSIIFISNDYQRKSEIKKEKEELYKQINIKRSKLWLEINNLSLLSVFCNDICNHILSFVIDDIIKYSLEKLAMNYYYKKYYGDFSWLGIKHLWSQEEKNIFDKKLNSLEYFDYIKSVLKENEECRRRFEETGLYTIRRSYNTMSAEISHVKYHDKEGNCSIYNDLCDYDKETANNISNKIRVMNNKELAGTKIVSFIRRRVLT